jgi:tetratricopeptide (TPR) repeat protein
VAVWSQAAGEALSSWERIPLNVRLANAVVSYATYLGQMFWPANLAVFYPYPAEGIDPRAVAASLALLIGLTLGTLYQGRRRPYLPCGWLWFLGTMLPVIGIVQVGAQARADRYMYFPMIGLLIAGTWLSADLLRRSFANPRVSQTLATIVLLACCMVSWNQTRHWRNSIALFTHSVQVTDESWLLHATLAAALMDDPNRFAEAEAHLRESLRIKPDYETAHFNLALVLSDLGDLSQANSHFREAIALKPDHVRARLLLCLNLKRLGLHEELARELAELDAQPASLSAEVRSALDTLRAP